MALFLEKCFFYRKEGKKKMKKLFSSESVTEGHPDKVADYISDSVLDAILKEDPNARVACETAVTTNYALLFGEITTTAHIDYEKVVKEAIKHIGYDKAEYGYNADDVIVDVRIKEQSPDIKMGVDESEIKEQGAG